MTELPKGLQSFIARDLNYLIGGGCVIASFLYTFERLPAKDGPVVLYVLGAGIAYVVGYALQDIFSVIHFVTTARIRKPNRIVKWLYKLFTGDTWRDLSRIDWSQSHDAIRQYLKNETDREEYQRIISLMMIGTTMSPCCLVSSILVLCKFWFKGKDLFDLMLGLAAFGFSMIFLVIAWIKTAQLTQEDATAISELKDHAQAHDPRRKTPGITP